MTLFQQILPRLNRPLARREDESGETTRDNGLMRKPVYDLKETDEAWTLTVQLPGVAKEGLELTAEEDIIRIRGDRAWRAPEGWTALYRESVDAPFELTFEHDHSIDVEKIRAELKDGVLSVTLPKVEAVAPRKIAVT